ncbi:MAG: RelA/SpoT family protein [Pseudomonadota bacterium]|jgi:guanosine-3',5'-bis(diphosphate) 3'-pyrophosphohydrolase
MSFEQIAEALKKYHPSPDLQTLKKAYEFAQKSHSGQVRASGEPYFTHVEETSLLVCKLKLDEPSVIASLLHDTIEDCDVTRDDIQREFGSGVADIVEGVTKLTRIEFESREEKQAENFRKMLLAMAKDIRVILVKLCDRLHNMRTLKFFSEEKQRRIAEETEEIYAPLANRLGIHWLKSELEDLCFFYLRPELYRQIDEYLKKSAPGRDAYVERTALEIQKTLSDAGVSASVKGRGKHLYSIWQKMEKDNISFEQMYDLLGFRVIVPTVRACYETLGIVHSTWKPIPGRFKDYIAMPKPNMYQSLHTTLIGPGGQRIEIQIRTPDMHRVAEEGIAAHWRYKEGGAAPAFDLQWVKELVETQQYLKNPDEFIQSVKGELYPEEVFVFTPKGDLVRLAFGSTPVDFAYAVHTDVGHRTIGAKVNGQMVALDHVLANGDTIEIVTSKSHVPSKDWLRFVRSSKARQRIRAFLKTEEHARSLALGMDLLTKDMRKVKLSLKKVEKDGRLSSVANELGFKTDGELFAALGYGRINSSKIIAKLLPEQGEATQKLDEQPTPLQRIFHRAAQVSRERIGVKVSGLDNIVIRFAKCCQPLPGDRVVGFITRGRGVTVHYADCPHVLDCDPLRRVEVDWDSGAREAQRVRITVHAQDQMGLLANVSQAVAGQGTNITSAQIKTAHGRAYINFEILVSSAEQLQKIKRSIEMVAGVIKVERVKHIANGAADDSLEGAD